MVKSKAFRKLVALTAAIALVCIFAVSAGAVTVTSVTTTYTNDLKVEVTANVTALAGAEVTYYAENDEGVFFLDQTTADSNGAAQFKYVTDAANLKSTAILNETAGTKIDDTIPGYEVSFGGVAVQKIPETNTGATVVINYTVPSGFEITGVTATNDVEVVSYVPGEGIITVVLGAVSADTTLDVTKQETVVIPKVGQYIAGAALKDGSVKNDTEDEGIMASAGDRKLTVIGKVSGVEEYGIIVAEEAITATEMDAATFATYASFEALQANEDGYFAIQLIDTSDEATAAPGEVLISANGTYYAAVYYKDGESYKIFAGSEIIPQ